MDIRMKPNPELSVGRGLWASSAHVPRQVHRSIKSRSRPNVTSSSYLPQNEFPVFSLTGDVEIVINLDGDDAHQNRYLLHSHTLARFSGFFNASLSPKWNRSPSPDQTKQSAFAGSSPRPDATGRAPFADSSLKPRWRYELDASDVFGDLPMLIQKREGGPTPSVFNRAPPSAPASSASSSLSDIPAHPFLISSAFRSSSENISTAPPSMQSATNSTTAFPRKAAAALPFSPSDGLTDEQCLRNRDLLRDYDNMFRIFYNCTPNMDSHNIAIAYVECKSLLTLADLYDALDVVGPRVDHHLLQFQWRLWRQVAKYPISYLRLGFRARSRLIFLEALIHVVGQWPAGKRTLQGSMPPHVLEIIEEKVAELDDQVRSVESRLLRLTLFTKSGEPVTPSNAYLDWLAVSFFRQWLVTQPTTASSDLSGNEDLVTPSMNGFMFSLPPLTSQTQVLGRMYRKLGAHRYSSDAYLTHDECRRFLRFTPDLYTRENLRRFERRIKELKDEAYNLVRPLISSDLELAMMNAGRGDGDGLSERSVLDDIPYLVCTQVDERDLPW
ncbi:hypothetical protein BROUX41_000417 [Berkeleyomyces rouxiae]|uniref:uncharacterized protein n=1 Tax=Berkeleyomyces rouxiae TaxID=2035830 RepID=UPI003B7F8D2E